MIKILSTEQIRKADEYTIKSKPILSYDLMERASEAFVQKFIELFPKKKKVRVFCGTGNNGGDGLAIGRLLKDKGWEVLKYVVGNPRKGTEDFKKNLDRSDLYAVINTVDDLPGLDDNEILIDALFGSGLSRPIEGIYKEVIEYLNKQHVHKVSVDMPSGLYADQPIENDTVAFNADTTITFQLPKLAFLLPQNHEIVGKWHVVDIGLSHSFIKNEETNFYLTEKNDLIELIPIRKSFTHKSEVGKLTIVAGSKGKIGAAVLAARAAFRSGVGLLNICSPKCGTQILQIAVPEAMVIEGTGESHLTKIPKLDDAIAIGPGLGISPKTITAFENLLKETKQPIVIDADALNILAKKKSLLKLVPKGSILTPHPGEFKRLVGNWNNDFEKLEKLSAFSKKHKLNLVLKGAYSAVCDSKGEIYFNPTGNPVLATAGSGDVLTGIIGAFLSNGLAPFDALKLGVYIHGFSGDLLAYENAGHGSIASDIIEKVPQALSETYPKLGI